jgi:uncharacterized cofD-like protein
LHIKPDNPIISLMAKLVVATVGGGTGSPVVNEALLRTGKVNFINAIAAVFDSGGATGRRRLDSRGREIAYSDAMRILLSLIDPKDINGETEVIKKWFSHRDERDAVLGQEIFNRFFEKTSGFNQIECDLKSLGIHLKGNVIPSTTHPTNIEFVTQSGRRHVGEHLLDGKIMSKDSVVDMSLKPKVPAYTPAISAIIKSDAIFIACGSPHGSVLCNFLPLGMKEAMKKTKAKKYLITNLVSARNETHDFTLYDYLKMVKKYAGVNVNVVIVPNISRREFEAKYKDVAALYDLEYSYFLGWKNDELEEVRASGVKVVTHNAIKIIDIKEENTKIVRHDPVKLAEALKKIL